MVGDVLVMLSCQVVQGGRVQPQFFGSWQEDRYGVCKAESHM